MAFMLPYIEQGDWYEVDTTAGTYWVSTDIAGDVGGLADGQARDQDDDDCGTFQALQGAVYQYVEGAVQSVTMHRGWYGARLSAPGYMDCTDWSAFPTEQEARDYLVETYDICLDCGEDADCCDCETED